MPLATDDDLLELGPCPVCGAILPLTELPLHTELHFAGEDVAGAPHRGHQQLPGAAVASAAHAPEVVFCHLGCGKAVALEDWDSHAAAHSLQDEEAARAAAVAAADAQRSVAQEEEARHFEQLQARYGFSDKRPGSCFRCGAAGHWASDCPSNPAVQRAAARPRVAPAPAPVAAAQRQEAAPACGGDELILRLSRCVDAQRGELTAYLSGPVAHYSSSGSDDAGWGCGYRNCQMLASHLLDTQPEVRGALFGGAGWVPDVPSLQAWLEAAWAAGYDELGAQQLGGSVQGGRKWVGTTEVAAMLAPFGVRSRIIDFEGRQDAGKAASTSAPDGAAGTFAVHPGVQCDSCGMQPIMGARYRSQVVPDYDLCAGCHAKQRGGGAAPYNVVQVGVKRPRVQLGREPPAESLVGWVWQYFSGGDGGSAPAAAASDARRVHLTGRCPLYFQHDGHSRTIVGIERRPRGGGGGKKGVGRSGSTPQYEYQLLVLDPGVPARKLADALQEGCGWQVLAKRGVHTLRKPEYQLLYCERGLAGQAEREAMKVVAAAERYRTLPS